jgi:hypothetical protein
MTINDQFFKQTQENLRRIKAENNKTTFAIYKIDGKAEELPSTQPSKPQETTNVVSLANYRKNKENAEENARQVSLEERQKRISESIKRINSLMEELHKRTKND